MANLKRSTQRRTSALQLVGHPAPLVVLVATGVAVAFGGWMAAVGGAVAYAAAVAVTAALRAPEQAAPSLAPPKDVRPSLKSREILALSMRIRKAHRELYNALLKADATVRLTLTASYERIETLVEGTRELATRADGLQLHIDASRARGDDPAALARVISQRETAALELVRVAEAIEAVIPRISAGSTIELDDASQVAAELAGELEHMRELIDDVGLK